MRKTTLGGIGLLAIASAFAIMGKHEQVKRDALEPKTPTEPDLDARQRVVNTAAGEIGPQDPAKYWAEVLPGVSSFKGAWCGGFSLWALHQAGLAQGTNWTIGKGFCYQLPQTTEPLPGDIAYIDQPYQHHAIVEYIDGDTVHTIDGNQPGNQVLRRERPRSSITAFYSIDPYIRSVSV